MREEKMQYTQVLAPKQRDLLEQAMRHYAIFRDEGAAYRREAEECREIYHLKDKNMKPEVRGMESLQMTTLRSTIDNSVADQMDNMPEAVMIPERIDLKDQAEDLTDLTRHVLAVNDWESLHRKRVEDFYITGTSVVQIAWDESLNNGKGDVALIRYPIEHILYDPSAEDIQDGRALIKVSWHPRSWYKEHYPDVAKYISSDEDKSDMLPAGKRTMHVEDEDRVMLMEYWYRTYDALKKKYHINVAYFAGGALLEEMEDVYEHGMYPFVFDVFARRDGEAVGSGLIHEMKDTMRAINRNATYMEVNSRFNSKPRMFVNTNNGIDPKEIADWNNDIITGEGINAQDVQWFPQRGLSGIVPNELARLQADLKQDSGQNNFARGESGGGITAASAIAALQEAGGKITRYRTAILNGGFREIVMQILWIMKEYYKHNDILAITGRQEQLKIVEKNSGRLFGGLGKETPPYTVQIQVQRRNPLRIQAQNELLTQAFSMAAQSGQHFPLTLYFEMLNIDGKDRIMPALQQVDKTTEILQNAQQQMAQAEQMAQENEALKRAMEEMQQKLQVQNEYIKGSFAMDEEPVEEANGMTLDNEF